MVYGPVKELPEVLRRALKSVDYGAKDINIDTAEKISAIQAGGQGKRCFVILVNLLAETFETHYGSWNGANCWNPNNSVDLDDKEYPIPLNGAVIKGSEGYPRTFASITLHPENIIKALPEAVELTEEERGVMYAYGALKSGPYRQSYTAGKEAVVERLIQRGLLKRNAAGSVQITTAGKNSRQRKAGMEW